MTLYAKVDPSHAIVDYQDGTRITAAQIAGTGLKAGWRWLPVVDQSSNTSTLDASLTQSSMAISAVDANSTQVTRTTTTTNLTGQALTDAKAAQASGMTYRELKLAGLFLEVLFDLKKSVTPGTTKAQFQSYALGLSAITDQNVRDFIQNKL